MLHLTKGLTENIYFTAAENSTTPNGSWIIYFKNRLTNETLNTTLLTNTSSTLRFQKVSINVNTYFLNNTTGFWEYEIEDMDGTIVEKGFMYLHPSTNFAPTEYTEQVNTFVTYNGE